MFSVGGLGSYFLSSTLGYVYLEVSKPLMNKWLFNGKLKCYIGNKQGFNRLSTFCGILLCAGLDSLPDIRIREGRWYCPYGACEQHVLTK